MTRRRTAHNRARSRPGSTRRDSFNIYRISRNQEHTGAYEARRISNRLKRQRLQFMYDLTFAPSFEKQFKDNIQEARAIFHTAYRQYAEPQR